MTDTDCSTLSDSLSIEGRDYAQEQDFSDDSSFYGQQTVKQRYQHKIPEFDAEDYWRVHHWNLQVVVARMVPKHGKRKREDYANTDEPEAKKSKQSGIKSAKSQIPPLATEPFNPYKDLPTALQIDEPVSDFLHRLKPSAARTSHPWIWCANFHAGSRETDPRLAEFRQVGTALLEQYSQKREFLESSFDPPKPAGTITRMLSPDRKQLEDDLVATARKYNVKAGKWMLFASPPKVDAWWAAIVRATIDGRLGISAKVATKPDNAAEPTHVICIYVKDFADQNDLERVLLELIKLNLAAPVPGPLERGDPNVRKQIYFKADAYTWLDIMSDNEYKLRASMYSTSSLLTKADMMDVR